MYHIFKAIVSFWIYEKSRLINRGTMLFSYQKNSLHEKKLNISMFLLPQFYHKFNLDKLPVFGFEFQCLVLAQNEF